MRSSSNYSLSSCVNDGIPEEFSKVQCHMVAQKFKQAGSACIMASQT